MLDVKSILVPVFKVVDRGCRSVAKLPIPFLIIILGASVMSGLLLGGSFLKERWEPRIEYLDNYLPVDPDKTEFVLGGGGYLNEKCECRHMIYTSWSAKRFRVTIESLSEELQVLDGNKTVEAVPYVLQEGNLPEERCIWLGFTVVMPNQTGTYDLGLSIRLSALLFSREYKWRYAFEVVHPPPDKPFENCLIMALDKETYHQGDNITMTIKNILNESIGFIDCKIVFEKSNGMDWEFYDSIPISLTKTYLDPREIGQFTLALINYMDHPFPTGQYRLGIIRYFGDEIDRVYAEFEVI